MKIEDILIIENGAENYGISSGYINQISRVPALMELPLRPFGVRGLCAVGGSVVTMVDMNLLLDMPQVDLHAEKSRLLSLNDGHASNALLVSEIYNTVKVEPEHLQYREQDGDAVLAIYKYKNKLVQIISLETLFSKINRVKIEAKDVKNGKVKSVDVKEGEINRFLIFSMGSEKFALNIEYLREIIVADVEYTTISGSSPEVLGLITLRDELITVIDLRLYYDFRADASEKNRILIASFEGKKIGLLVDKIVDIKNFLTKDIEYMYDSFEDKKVSGVIHNTDSLVSFFDSDVLNRLFSENEAFIHSQNTDRAQESEDIAMEVVVFKIEDKEYAFDVKSVAEIIDAVELTKVAYTNKLVDGITNIRGQIVTIISLFNKLNISPRINEESKIIICNLDHNRVGFVVDSVSDILNVKTDEIKQSDGDFFTNVLHLQNGKRLVLSMDIHKIISDERK